MISNIFRINSNKFYILYRRIKNRKDTIPLYVIYRTEEFGGDIFKEFNNKRGARNTFNKATVEAVEYEKELAI
jgi:hypothetical protein